jgi:PHP domain
MRSLTFTDVMQHKLLGWLLTVLIAAASSGCGDQTPYPRASFARALTWADRGVWLKADTHVHTRFSDGQETLEQVVRRGEAFGCNVLALTDHADAGLTATSEDYFLELEAARRAHPNMVLLAGLEWNVPPWQGREHANVIVPPGVHERKLLRDFQVLFDDFKRQGRDPSLATSALHWLKENSYGIGGLPIVFYNHPNRKRESISEFATEFASWKAGRDIAVGFEGAPGHQEAQPLGAYQEAQPTIDRWDPAVAKIGDAWDQLLQQGAPVWAALATSDFHNADPQQLDDYWPGEFSETWLYAPTATAQGALDALRAGSFFGAHGHIVRQVRLQVTTADLPRPALAGEAIRVPPGSSVDVMLEMIVPSEDWSGKPNEIDEVELIVISASGAKSVHQQRPPRKGLAAQLTLPVQSGGMTVRARGRRMVNDGPDLMFYTNPIQVLIYGAAAADLAIGNVTLTVPQPQPAANSQQPEQHELPAFVLLAFIVCGGVFVSLIDRWRIEAARRYVGKQIDHPPPHTRPHSSIRLPLLALLALGVLAIVTSLSPFHFVALDVAGALTRWWTLLQQPLQFDASFGWVPQLLLFLLIGFLATWILLGRQSSDRRRMATLPLVVAGCIIVSAGLQLAQLFTADVVLSQNHIIAQSLGGLLGGAAWLVLSPLLQRKSHKRSAAQGAT